MQRRAKEVTCTVRGVRTMRRSKLNLGASRKTKKAEEEINGLFDNYNPKEETGEGCRLDGRD